MRFSDPKLLAAWLFTRDRESVRVELRRGPHTSLQIVVYGPDRSEGTYEFPDAPSALLFQVDHEREIMERGFRLHARAERRSGRDRRDGPRATGTSRRRSRR